MPKISDSFLSPLKELSKLLTKTKTEGVIIGGISVGLLGKPRFTADVDAVILLDFKEIAKFIKIAAKYGFDPRLKDAVEFARKSHVILLNHRDSGINVDLSIGLLPFEKEMVKESKKFQAEGVTFNIPLPEDLIIMKAVAHRPKDIEDIRTILACQSKLDLKKIRRWVKEFAKALEMPEIYDDIKKILTTRS